MITYSYNTIKVEKGKNRVIQQNQQQAITLQQRAQELDNHVFLDFWACAVACGKSRKTRQKAFDL